MYVKDGVTYASGDEYADMLCARGEAEMYAQSDAIAGYELALAQATAMVEQKEKEIARLRDELTAARKTNSEWLAANGPGGWINDLRVENERLRTDIAHWQSETQAWVKTCNRATESRWKLHAESERLRDENVRLRAGLTEICTFPRHRMPGEIARETLAAMQKGE